MKNLNFFLVFMVTASMCLGQTPCQNGFAGSYPCNDYDLMSHISLSQMSASAGNDSWGWTDSLDGKEYALIGLNNGTAFIDISDPVNPVYLGKLPTSTTNSSWRDVKVYNNHAFIVSEASNHGMQVFDLTKLRNVASPPQTFTADALYSGFGSAHNIVINEASGYAYGVGTTTFNGGPHFVNIQNPTSPVAAGGYNIDGYSHDAQVITYTGPDPDYTGREILIGSNENEVVIVDITNKAAPTQISTISYTNVGYTHQGWFTEDQRYFILGDETDEQGVGFNTRTIIFDFQDLDNPQQHMIYTGPTAAIDHNGYVQGNKFYMANYRAGIRVLDVSSIGSQSISEVGYFDTYPASNSASFNGAWNVYPFFSSGNIVISDIEGGFFLVRQSTPVVCNAAVPSGLSVSNVLSTSATAGWDSVAGATYDVRYKETSESNWTDVSSNVASYSLSGLSPSTEYEIQVRSRCPDNSTSAFSVSTVFTTQAVQLNYCSSASTNVNDEYISRVQLGTIDNSSGAQFYSDFTGISTNLMEGQNYSITVTPTWTGTVYREAYAVWIDYNVDGDFTDAGEQVWTQAATTATPNSGSFTIPSGTGLGATRMRVSMKYNGIPTSCETFTYGEVEDYTVVLEESVPDTEAPTIPTNLIASNVGTTTVDLSWNASTDNIGVTGYDVFQGAANLGTVTNTSTEITGLSAGTSYSFSVQARDAAGNISGMSNSVNITTNSGGGTTVLHEGFFETGWDGWIDGGSDSFRYSGSRSYEGNYSIRLRDNTNASVMTLGSFDVQAYTNIEIDFYFYSHSMENGEDFWVQFYDGSSWNTVSSYARGTDFNNNTFYNVTVNIPSAIYNYPSNAQFRFRCDASGNADHIYIDQVKITATSSSPFAGNSISSIGPVSNGDPFEDDLDIEGNFLLYPNPASSVITIKVFDASDEMKYRVINMLGQTVLYGDLSNNRLDVSSLQNGVYFVELNDEEEIMLERFIKK